MLWSCTPSALAFTRLGDTSVEGSCLSADSGAGSEMLQPRDDSPSQCSCGAVGIQANPRFRVVLLPTGARTDSLYAWRHATCLRPSEVGVQDRVADDKQSVGIED